MSSPLRSKLRRLVHGDATWVPVQNLLVRIVTAAAGWPDLESAQPVRAPSRADQLALSGFISMADWIASASDETHFRGVACFDDVSMEGARHRAVAAWSWLGLRGGWGSLDSPGAGHFLERFGQAPRPFQAMVVEAAESMPVPGLMVVEAPMGEGKTEAALAAAEILAARFGCDGVYVAMPTQATSDAMYDRVNRWLGSFEARPDLALLHGRRLLSERIRARERSVTAHDGQGEDVDGYGMATGAPSFASVCEDLPAGEDEAGRPAEWFFGRHRGLLAANCVGTIDQVLYAGTRTKYVALRYAGLAGKVVIFDEVHATDTSMAQFLAEVLWWLGNGTVPVVLLSATLAPAQRDSLVTQYLEGATVATTTAAAPVPAVNGYPGVTCAWPGPAAAQYDVRSAGAWRQSLEMEVSLCEEDGTDSDGAVLDALAGRLRGGGCALVIRNTVARAQQTYRRLRESFGDDVVLLHSRFTAEARARKTKVLLNRLGADGRLRPDRLVVVATQVAEQSFDIDADVLVTDLAPVDLLLQRAGRVHRHDRPTSARPAAVRLPEIVVTGLRFGAGNPWFPAGSEAIYGRHHLLRSAALVNAAAGGTGWSVPADVPALVATAYGTGQECHAVPGEWAADEAQAAAEWAIKEAERRRAAKPYLLTAADQRYVPTLAGLHTRGGQATDVERHVRVRDGEMGEEVVVVIDDDGDLRTVEGLRLGPTGEAGCNRPEEVLGSSVRLPAYDAAIAAAVYELRPLPGWDGDPWLGKARALRLDRSRRAELDGRLVTYDDENGLEIGQRR